MQKILSIENFLDKFLTGIVILLLALMLSITTAQIISRFVLGRSIVWGGEISLNLFVWIIFLGLPLGIKSDRHFRLKEIERYYPDKVQAISFYVSHLFMLVFLAFVIRNSIIWIRGDWGTRFLVSRLEVQYFYMSIPIGSFFALIMIVIKILKKIFLAKESL